MKSFFQNNGKKVLIAGQKSAQWVTATFKAMNMAFVLFSIIMTLVTMLLNLIQKNDTDSSKNISNEECESYVPSLHLLIVSSGMVAITGLLLLATKQQQTNFKKASKVIMDIESDNTTINEQYPLVSGKRNEETCKSIPLQTIRVLGNIVFCAADATLNAHPYASLTGSPFIDWPIAGVCFIFLLNQDIRYSRELNELPSWKIHDSVPGKGVDFLGTLTRVGAAKISLWRLIDAHGFSTAVDIFLKTLGVIEPSLILSKWSNYQATSSVEKSKITVGRAFLAIWIDLAYALQDGALYAFGGQQSAIFNKEVYRCEEISALITAGGYALAEAIAYGPKYLELAQSKFKFPCRNNDVSTVIPSFIK